MRAVQARNTAEQQRRRSNLLRRRRCLLRTNTRSMTLVLGSVARLGGARLFRSKIRSLDRWRCCSAVLLSSVAHLGGAHLLRTMTRAMTLVLGSVERLTVTFLCMNSYLNEFIASCKYFFCC